MGLERAKGKVGSNRSHMSRKRAIRKLHLTSNEFRRLCILKGIYPAEPKNNQKIKSQIALGKVYYRTEDVQFLSHEPIIWKFWELKTFLKRMKRLKARNDIQALDAVREHRPFYQLGHIVKERYPSFVEAIRDLDDCLSMLFMYARFASNPMMDHELVSASRRLTVEFMHYIIDSRSLRRAFISVKGYYLQSEIMGQAVTWIMPHEFVIPKLAEVDVNIMRSFTEFYVQLMGFVNFKLYTGNNMVYPARAVIKSADAATGSSSDDLAMDLLEALNRPVLKREKIEEEKETQADKFEDDAEMDGAEDVKSVIGLTFAETTKLQHLFEGMKFFLNREVPREVMSFVIRSFGGDVSWHATTAAGSTYEESDAKITHQVVDRSVQDRRLDRVYVQPQWLFDCVNMRKLIPVQEYFPGSKLPPHLSPFVDDVNVREGTYVTPDAARLRGEEVQPVAEALTKSSGKKKEKVTNPPANESGDRVKTGKQNKTRRDLLNRELEAEEKKLAVMAIPKKKKRLYDKIMKLKKVKAVQAEKLLAKRQAHEKKAQQQQEKSQ